MYKLTRHGSNPILKPEAEFPWETEGVFNPGVVKVGNEVIMLYRAVGERDSYISHIGLAKSEDGVHFSRAFNKPVFGPSTFFDTWATEDPRITQIGNVFYITYVAVPARIMDHNHGIDRRFPLETATALLRTKDFSEYENLGIISPASSDNKDIVLFPRKMKGKSDRPRYCMLHRPNRWDKLWFDGSYSKLIEMTLPCPIDSLPTLPSIWLAWSDDLISWTDHEILLSPSHNNIDAKIGPGLPPIETTDGWLVIYHHVENTDNPSNFKYSVRAALLDLENPTKIIGKLPYDILLPELPYEKELGSHIVFPTGGFVDGDTLYVYYGASDKYIGLATGSLSALLQALKTEGAIGPSKHETV
jgi:predicted GH43/DUF377 family glycosyl hydrolase